MHGFFAKRYRIVRDGFCGYEVQARRWWLPIWLQCWNFGPTNTHTSIERAEEFAHLKAGPRSQRKRAPRDRRVVKMLGRLS